MGLDIHLITDNYEELNPAGTYDEVNFNKHSLSRTFCRLMCRKNVVKHETELDQVARITGIDITPLYGMEDYPDDESRELSLSVAGSEEEKQGILAQAEIDKEKLAGNIDNVLLTIKKIEGKLNQIDNLPNLLIQTDFVTAENGYYFSDFKTDKGKGYIGNNFGQDLRNFARFLEYAKSRGAKTVWFNYG